MKERRKETRKEKKKNTTKDIKRTMKTSILLAENWVSASVLQLHRIVSLAELSVQKRHIQYRIALEEREEHGKERVVHVGRNDYSERRRRRRRTNQDILITTSFFPVHTKMHLRYKCFREEVLPLESVRETTIKLLNPNPLVPSLPSLVRARTTN